MEKRKGHIEVQCWKTISGKHMWIHAAVPIVKEYDDDVWKPSTAHVRKCAACGLVDDR